MAKLLDLLVAAEGFVPVAGRVYAQDGDGEVWGFECAVFSPQHDQWGGRLLGLKPAPVTLADDYQTAVITAESIMEARACL